tara:strand:- start:421 stop:720 length:300 start_codon:yes stop_codon:yes gene_type:complete
MVSWIRVFCSAVNEVESSLKVIVVLGVSAVSGDFLQLLIISAVNNTKRILIDFIIDVFTMETPQVWKCYIKKKMECKPSVPQETILRERGLFPLNIIAL